MKRNRYVLSFGGTILLSILLLCLIRVQPVFERLAREESASFP